MFNEIPTRIAQRMHDLEERDSKDRVDGTSTAAPAPSPPETGRFIALWAASAPSGAVVEVGTSAGYSTLWLALPCRATGRTLTTYEILADKAQLARRVRQAQRPST